MTDMTIIGALWAVVMAIGIAALRGLGNKLRDQSAATARAAESMQRSLERQLSAEEKRWVAHEEEHREFRRDMLDLSRRLAHLEGEHAQRWRQAHVRADPDIVE